MKSFTVYYRTGGTQNAKWHKCNPVPTVEQARKEAGQIERMGYKALYAPTDRLETIGLPEGWDYETWANDHRATEVERDAVAILKTL